MATATRRSPSPADVLGRVTLITGKEEFLNERTIRTVREAVAGHDPDAEFADALGADLTLGTLGELSAPSLFSSTRCVVVRELERLPDESVAGLLGYCAEPVEDVALVLAHSGGQKGSGVLAKLRKLPSVTEVKSTELRPSEIPGFVSAEVRSWGGQIDGPAATALVTAVGTDLRSLASAAHQLVSDHPGQRLDAETVGRYFGGRAEAKSFAIADAAIDGKIQRALEDLRWALETGTPPVLVTSAFAGGIRGLARYKTAPRGMREADLARAVGVPPWKLRTLRGQAQGWSEPMLGQALRAVASADADIKGAAHDAAYSLERLVLTIGRLRRNS
jgi:DNA polymerase III subunit delta